MSALNWEQQQVKLPFNGRYVTHTLRRPLKNARIGNESGISEPAKFRALQKSVTINKGRGVQVDQDDSAAAFDWLWNRLVIGIAGYAVEGQDDPLTDATRAALKAIHKETAVAQIVGYRVEVDAANCVETMTGGTYAVDVWQGNWQTNSESYVGKFFLNFWTETQRTKFKGAFQRITEQVGGVTQTRVVLNLFEAETLFDQLIERADGCGVSDGQTIRPAAKGDLIAFSESFLKEAVISKLFLHWETLRGK